MNRLSIACQHRFASGFALDCAFETEAQVTALFGPSGAGKTSLLSVIAGLLLPEHGEVRWRDKTWLDTKRSIDVPAEERHVGYVFQDHRLFPHLNVERNLNYGRKRRQRSAATVEFSRVVEVLELADLLGRFPDKLSGGEKQRVALGRALLSSPELLLMDEPLAALDEAIKQRILTYIERVAREFRLPILYVSHNAAEVRRLAQQVVVISGGKVGEVGTPENVLLAGYFTP